MEHSIEVVHQSGEYWINTGIRFNYWDAKSNRSHQLIFNEFQEAGPKMHNIDTWVRREGAETVATQTKMWNLSFPD